MHFSAYNAYGCSLATKPESTADESTATNDNCLMEVYPNPVVKGETVVVNFNFHLAGLYKLVITNVLEQVSSVLILLIIL